jgi:hypothetical protein
MCSNSYSPKFRLWQGLPMSATQQVGRSSADQRYLVVLRTSAQKIAMTHAGRSWWGKRLFFPGRSATAVRSRVKGRRSFLEGLSSACRIIWEPILSPQTELYLERPLPPAMACLGDLGQHRLQCIVAQKGLAILHPTRARSPLDIGFGSIVMEAMAERSVRSRRNARPCAPIRQPEVPKTSYLAGPRARSSSLCTCRLPFRRQAKKACHSVGPCSRASLARSRVVHIRLALDSRITQQGVEPRLNALKASSVQRALDSGIVVYSPPCYNL